MIFGRKRTEPVVVSVEKMKCERLTMEGKITFWRKIWGDLIEKFEYYVGVTKRLQEGKSDKKEEKGLRDHVNAILEVEKREDGSYANPIPWSLKEIIFNQKFERIELFERILNYCRKQRDDDTAMKEWFYSKIPTSEVILKFYEDGEKEVNCPFLMRGDIEYKYRNHCLLSGYIDVFHVFITQAGDQVYISPSIDRKYPYKRTIKEFNGFDLCPYTQIPQRK